MTKILLWVILLALVAAAVTSYILWVNGAFDRWFPPARPPEKAAPAAPSPAPTSAPAHTRLHHDGILGAMGTVQRTTGHGLF
jgi:hypothetical protein